MNIEDREFIEKSSDKVKEFIDRFIARLKCEYRLTDKEITELLIKTEERLVRKEVLMPITIYDNKELSALETNCKYLKEELKLRYHQIALLLNRDERTIWTTYNNAKKKRKERVIIKITNIFIPSSIFKDRRISVLESLVRHLKDKYELTYHKIALLLDRDERNIWAVYNRAKKKERAFPA